MSFLGNIVDSIGGERAPPPPAPKPPSRPASANAVQKPNNTAKPVTPILPTSSTSGLKRKADDDSVISNGKLARPNNTNNVRDSTGRPGPSLLSTTKASSGTPSSPATVKPPTSQPASSTTSSAKPPPAKGSYAELMARAKQKAEERQQNQIGVIKHQERKKVKLTKGAERRLAEQERARGQKIASAARPREQVEARRSTSPVKKIRTSEPSSRPATAKPTYRGTMGTASSRSNHDHGPKSKSSRYDDYLGTDEEDDSDIMDEGEDYGSENSSDMEAGMDELDVEETKALRDAKAEDLREQALENRLKQEKDERRRKLLAMAKKAK